MKKYLPRQASVIYHAMQLNPDYRFNPISLSTEGES